jgi:hypothetical protein
VHRLHEQGGRKTRQLGFLATQRDHVGRDVAAVNVETGLQIWDQKPAGAAGNVECRLARLDEFLKVGDRILDLS